MKALIILIGILLVAGGLRAVIHPRPWTMREPGVSKKALLPPEKESVPKRPPLTVSSAVIGYPAILFGALTIFAGLKVSGLKTPKPHSLRLRGKGDW